MKAEIKKELEQAIELKNRGLSAEAVDILKKLEIKHGDSKETTGLISMLLFHNLKKPKESLKYAVKWTKLSPKSEMASINLVHILFDLNEQDNLEKEIRRFIKTGVELDFYTDLFEENVLTKKDFC